MNQSTVIIDIHPVLELLSNVLSEANDNKLFLTVQDREHLCAQVFDRAIRLLIFLDDDQPRSDKVVQAYRQIEKPLYRYLKQNFTLSQLNVLRAHTHIKTLIFNHQLKVFSWH